MHLLPQNVTLVYRAPASTRWLGIFLGGLLTLVGMASAALLLLSWRASDTADAFWIAFVGVVTLSCGIPALATSLRYQLSLMPQSFILRSAWKTETMARSDIAGYRNFGEYGGNVLIFISRRGPAHGVAVKLSFQTDAAFLAWMEGIPDLDVVDLNA